jgi:hypothetical protein
MMKRTVLLAVLIFNAFWLSAHPVHVSLCNVEIEKQEITIAIKLFSDDFQLALYHNYGKEIPIKDLILQDHKELVDHYVNKALQIVLNKKDSIRFSYSKAEMNEEAIWLYYTEELENVKKLEISNSLLLDIYLDQTNLVIINYRGKQNGYRFNSRNREEIINLK